MLSFSDHLLASLRCRVFLCFVVTTSGSITVKLTNDCWGHVSVCLGTSCGGACKDSWSQKMSSMLCQSLSCGKPIQPTTYQSSQKEVLITSFHTTTHTRSLSQSAMVANTQSCVNNPAYVVCSGKGQHHICSECKWHFMFLCSHLKHLCFIIYYLLTQTQTCLTAPEIRQSFIWIKMHFNSKNELIIGAPKSRIESHWFLLRQVASRPILNLPDTNVLEMLKFPMKGSGFQWPVSPFKVLQLKTPSAGTWTVVRR